MKSENFAYWLQGWVEIDAVFKYQHEYDEAELARWTKMVAAHLDMVLAVETTPSAFCQWMQGFLAAGNATEEGIRRVAKRLAEEFTHVIDPSFPEEKQAELSAIHSPPPVAKPEKIVAVPTLTPDQSAYIAEAVKKPDVDMSTVIGGPHKTIVSPERLEHDGTHKVVQWVLPRYLLTEVEQYALDRKQGIEQSVVSLLDRGLHPDGRPRC